MARTRAQENRAIRQEAMREQLSKQKHHEKVIELLQEINELHNAEEDVDKSFILECRKVEISTHLKLVNKYIPDLKAVEHDGGINVGGFDEWVKGFADRANQNTTGE